MSKSLRNTVFILFAIALLGSGLWAWYVGRERYNWSEAPTNKKAYSAQYDQPYGGLVFKRLIDGLSSGYKAHTLSRKISETLPSRTDNPCAYIFIGGFINADSSDIERLLQFAKNGNTALLISRRIPRSLQDSLFRIAGQCSHQSDRLFAFLTKRVVHAQLLQPEGIHSPGIFLMMGRDTVPNDWQYFDPRLFCPVAGPTPIGNIDDAYVNFVEFPIGKGRVLLHANPLFFTNYHLIRPEARSYAEGVLSWLPKGDIYWDEFSRRNISADRAHATAQRRFGQNSPLAYIMAEPALAWAWYLLVIGALLWIIFRGRRRQRITPILPRNENSSYAYISAIARLHFVYSDYRNLCFQSMRLFLLRVRERYNLAHSLHPHTHMWPHDPEFVRRLSLTSEVPAPEIESLISLYNKAMKGGANSQLAVDLYSAIEFFFKKAR